MDMMPKTLSQRLPGLLRGDSERLQLWIRATGWQYSVWCVLVIAVGAGAYGASIGAWRSPLQALYTAIKLPLILLLTTAGNSVLNASLAPLMGVAISPRQTVLSLLSSFALFHLGRHLPPRRLANEHGTASDPGSRPDSAPGGKAIFPGALVRLPEGQVQPTAPHRMTEGRQEWTQESQCHPSW